MQPYRLAPNVYACASDEGAVFLDLDKDTYLGIDPDQSRALSLVVENWLPQRTGEHIYTEQSASEALSFARVLCDRGLLAPTPPAVDTGIAAAISDSSPHRHHRISQLRTVESELIPWEHMKWRHIRPSHVVRFLQSMLTAVLLLRCRRFSDVVNRARRRRAHRLNGPSQLHAPTARALLSSFFHIRAFFYAPKRRCLLDSITLLEFLAHYDQFPQWVIGVQITPFGSHSWIQHDAFVLNGTPPYVRAYTPILVV
jgi:hypothetical protein